MHSYSSEEKILVTGANGQLGSELTEALRTVYGRNVVIASDIRPQKTETGPFEELNVLDKGRFTEVIRKHRITQVFHLAAMLSATAERYPEKAWELNINSLLYILEAAREKLIKKVYWPSSIAAFGPNTPKIDTPQNTVTDPNTVYGISKLSGELWCRYHFEKYGTDIRSLRYPGLISHKAPPGGGTTDYAVDIFIQALKTGSYECFLRDETTLPMMYMDDAIRATLELTEAEVSRVHVRTSYNIAAVSFSPGEIAKEIQKHLPDFRITYNPDFRQQIAESWPRVIDDRQARKDWGWEHKFGLVDIVKDMLKNLQKSTVSQGHHA